MRHPRITIAAIAVAVAAGIGGITVAAADSSSNSRTPGYATTGAAAVAGGGSTTVQTTTATVRGKAETILVDSHGLPLYFYQQDTSTTSRVAGRLAALWPPLVAAAPTDRGVTGRVASVATANGQQVAYNGHFLYTFVQDRPGKVTGQGVQRFFVATPGLGGGAASAAPAPSSNAGYGY